MQCRMKATHSKLSLSSFSLNSVLRRHKRTNSLPEPAAFKTSHDSVSVGSAASVEPPADREKKIRDAIADIDKGTSNDESAVSDAGRRKKSGAAMKLERYINQLCLAKHEKILKVCPCFLVSELLTQGCLIITERHVCFYSNIFGLKKNKKIKYEEIVQVTKEKVYALFPTGIGVRTRSEKVTFSSATSRDKLMKLIKEQCKRFPAIYCDGDDGVQGTDEGVLRSSNSGSDGTIQSPGTASSDLMASEESADVLHPSQRDESSSSTAPASLLVAAGSTDETAGAAGVGEIGEVTTGPLVARERRRQSAASCDGDSFSPMTASQRILHCRPPVLVLLAVVLAICALVALHLTWRFGQMQQQVALIISSSEYRAKTLRGSCNFEQLELEVGGVISAVEGLRDRLLEMRALMLRLMSKGSTVR